MPEAEEASIELRQATPEPAEPEPAAQAEPAPAPVSVPEPAAAPEPVAKPEPEPKPAAPHQAIRAKAEAKKRDRRAVFTAGGLAMGFAALLLAAFLFRVDVVRILPGAAKAYAFIGALVNLAGFEVGDVEARRVVEGGRQVLILSGAVRNISQEVLPPPLIGFALLSVEGEELFAWTHQVESGAVAPGEATSFEARLADPPAEAADLRARLIAADEEAGPPPASEAGDY